MRRYYRFLGIACLIMVSLPLYKCEDPDLTESTTEDVVITGYFEKHPEQFSKFTEILELSGTAGFLGAYGTYTCFAPTNDAIDQYLQKKGVNAVSDITPEDLKNIVRFHIVQDTISTSRFTDGKLEKATMLGEYLVTGSANIEGNSFLRVNRQASITQSNIRANNGIIHVIDQVLEFASLTVAQMIEQNPDYSIFTAILKSTGFYDTLNTLKLNADGSRKFYTVIAQTNDVFKAAGFDDYQEVEDHYSKVFHDPKNPNDSLNLYAAYRVIPDAKYLADLITSPSHITRAPQEVITTRLEGTNVLINSDVFLGVQEPGSMIDRVKSDFSGTNGVLHSVVTNYSIKKRVPYPVYWEVSDQPELRKMVNFFRKPAQTVTLVQGALKDVTWGGTGQTITYYSAPPSDVFASWYVYSDHLTMQLRTAVVPWIEFKTPLLVKGKYKIWICFRVVASNEWQAFFDGEALPRIFGSNPVTNYPKTVPERDAESQGWKIYQVPTDGTFPVPASGNYRIAARLLGTVDVKTTDRHTFRINALTNRNGGGANANIWIDQVQFIPVDRDQIWPKFNTTLPNNTGVMVDHWPL